MHRILLREVVIDARDDVFTATRNFWSSALLAEARLVEDYPEFTSLAHPAAMSWVGLQNVADAAARLHLDIETDDVDAGVRRLVDLGATIVTQGRAWVVLKDLRRIIVLRRSARIAMVRRASTRRSLTRDTGERPLMIVSLDP